MPPRKSRGAVVTEPATNPALPGRVAVEGAHAALFVPVVDQNELGLAPRATFRLTRRIDEGRAAVREQCRLVQIALDVVRHEADGSVEVFPDKGVCPWAFDLHDVSLGQLGDEGSRHPALQVVRKAYWR